MTMFYCVAPGSDARPSTCGRAVLSLTPNVAQRNAAAALERAGQPDPQANGNQTSRRVACVVDGWSVEKYFTNYQSLLDAEEGDEVPVERQGRGALMTEVIE